MNLHNGNISHDHFTTILKINQELIICADLCLQILASPSKLADSRDKDLENYHPVSFSSGCHLGKSIWGSECTTALSLYDYCLN